MLSVTIIAVGGLKESYWREACGEYLKRLGAYCKPTVIEIPEAKLAAKPSQGDIRKALESEGSAILAKLPKQCHIISLCIEGRQRSSEELAQELCALASTASHVVLVIGGSHGLAETVKCRGDKLSMSRMTFPHQLARVMLMEQLYRAFSIAGGGKYHK